MSVAKVSANIKKISDQVYANITREFRNIAKDLEDKAVDLAPVDEGDLRESSTFEVESSRTEVTSYIGFDEEYALRQHENTTFKHPKGGQAKFLETPLKSGANKYKEQIGDAVKEGLRI